VLFSPTGKEYQILSTFITSSLPLDEERYVPYVLLENTLVAFPVFNLTYRSSSPVKLVFRFS
jgi:hypothetical protein